MNIFSVLDESDNEEEQPKVVSKAKDSKAAPVAAKNAAAKAVESKGKDVPASKPKTVVGDKPKTVVGDKPKSDKPKSAPVADVTEGDAAKDDNRGGRARGKEYRERGGRGGRGGAEGAADGERRPKRDFERRSGTGRGREVSKGGRGSFGFGNVAQDAQDAEKNPNAAEAILEPVDGAEESAEPEVVAEPEPVTFTLDEFLEKRNAARQALAKPTKERVVDQSTLAGLSRKEDEGETTYMPVKASKVDASKKDQRSTGKTQVLDVAFKFAAIQVDEERGGRGGRGEGRGRGDGRGRGGRGGRGEGRSNTSRPAGKAPAAFNNTDFPSL